MTDRDAAFAKALRAAISNDKAKANPNASNKNRPQPPPAQQGGGPADTPRPPRLGLGMWPSPASSHPSASTWIGMFYASVCLYLQHLSVCLSVWLRCSNMNAFPFLKSKANVHKAFPLFRKFATCHDSICGPSAPQVFLMSLSQRVCVFSWTDNFGATCWTASCVTL